MRPAGEHRKAAVRDYLAQVSTLIEGYVSVHLSLPDIDPGGNVLQTETPASVDYDVILGRPLPALAIAFLDVCNHQLKVLRILQQLAVRRWARRDQFFSKILGVSLSQRVHSSTNCINEFRHSTKDEQQHPTRKGGIPDTDSDGQRVRVH